MKLFVTVFVIMRYSHKVRKENATKQESGFHVIFLVATRLREVSGSAAVYFRNHTIPFRVWHYRKIVEWQCDLAKCVNTDETKTI
jgi:hypothetical protein